MKKLLTVFLLLVSYLVAVPAIADAENYQRWQFPKKIKTYIPPNHRRTVSMKHAFAEWTRLTNQRIVFFYVANPKMADIRVEFVSSIPNADREIGLTRSSYVGNGRLMRATISIADKTADGRTLGRDEVYTVMLHEIGHAIGIGEHSKDPLSIMYPTEDDRQEILKSDLKTLAEIYGWNK